MASLTQMLRTLFLSEDEEQERIGLNQALAIPPVWYAHNKICGDVGMLPLDIKRKRGRGAENDLKHDGYRLLREQPNAIQAPSVFKEQVTSHTLMYGNGRAAIMRDGDRVTEIIPLLPDRTWTVISDGQKYHITKPVDDKKRDMLGDKVAKNSNGYLVFRDEDVIHLTGFTYDGIEGLGLLQIASMTMQTGRGEQKHTNNQLAKGFRGKVFLEAPIGALRQEDDARKFIDDFNKAEAGADNAGKAGLLREGIKASTLSMNNNDAQFIELRKFTRQDVALLFGLENMPGDGESVSYNSLQQKNASYLQSCLDRWLIKWEEQCDMKLRTDTQKRMMSHYFKFNRGAILRMDMATTMSTFSIGRQTGILSANECREKLDMNPYDGGDEYENPNISVKEPKDPNAEPATDPTKAAMAEIARMPLPATEEQYRNQIKMVAENVATIVGMAPEQTITAIDCSVFLAWKNHKENAVSQRLERDALHATITAIATHQPIINVSVPEQKQGPITINIPERAITVEASEAPSVAVNIQPAEVKLDLNVDVDAKLPPRQTTTKITRDVHDRIKAIEQEEKDIQSDE